MSTVRAPYPSKMDEIHNQSVVSLARPGLGNIAEFSNRSDIVASLRIRNHPDAMAKALRRIGSGEMEAKDVILRDWHRPGGSAIPITGFNAPQVTSPGYAVNVAWSSDSQFLAVTHSHAPYLSVYKRLADQFIKLTTADFPPVETAMGLAWSMHAKALYVTTIASASRVYIKSNDVVTYLASGISVFSPVPTYTAKKLRMTKDGVYLAFISATNPTNKVFVMKRNSSNSKTYTNISSNNITPTSRVPEEGAWTQDGQYFAYCTMEAQPYLVINKRAGDAFTNINNLSNFGSSAYPVKSLAFSLDDKYLAVSQPTQPGIRIYQRTGDVFDYLTEITGSAVAGTIKDIVWTPDGKYLLATSSDAPYLSGYKFENGTLTMVKDCLPAQTARVYSSIEISPDGNYVALASDVAPFLEIFKGARLLHPVPYIRADLTAPLVDYSLAVV